MRAQIESLAVSPELILIIIMLFMLIILPINLLNVKQVRKTAESDAVTKRQATASNESKETSKVNDTMALSE